MYIYIYTYYKHNPALFLPPGAKDGLDDDGFPDMSRFFKARSNHNYTTTTTTSTTDIIIDIHTDVNNDHHINTANHM